MKKNKIIERLMNPGLVPVIRLDSGEKLNALLNAFLRGGITAAELTMTIPGAVDLLQKAKTVFGDSLLLGMGTVVDKQMAEDAREEGFYVIAQQFEGVAKIEKQHEERYLKLAENVKNNKVFDKDGVVVWKCQNCGYFHMAQSAPEVCPVCAHPQAYFKVEVMDY